MYENIDMKKTGLLLKETIEKNGYTVKDIQNILHLSCPQPIYRWFKGSILPSVDHLYVLSRLLKVHMEDLLVPQYVYSSFIEIHTDYIAGSKRLYEYGKRLCLMKSA
ncbi:MAG: helix-turn-helix domain-containing protein [Lachnospiraceae bacterium]|nr:helix-turn-helix domain-containing protein [Lachnospiraceae bacterium]